MVSPSMTRVTRAVSRSVLVGMQAAPGRGFGMGEGGEVLVGVKVMVGVRVIVGVGVVVGVSPPRM